MRLTDKQKAIIQTAAARIFGSSARVYLYGSRINDQVKGGDIDLMIDAEIYKMKSRNKVLFLVALKKQLGEQKIDVVYNHPGRQDQFINSMKKQAILL
ncbi:MAG: nucleotidyltransferase domain-containing protein [Bacteroidetes bacterium]|nr:nucleotidyltransferase domain-containing protein [Bacteroidota bacterium]